MIAPSGTDKLAKNAVQNKRDGYELSKILNDRRFYRAASMRAVLATSEMYLRLSIHLSVKRVNCDKKTKETCANIFITHQRSFILVFW